MSRKFVDCRDLPNEVGCTLAIYGEEDEVVKAAVDHAVSVHSHDASDELVEMVRAGLKDAEGAA